jgi:hypothetical protein
MHKTVFINFELTQPINRLPITLSNFSLLPPSGSFGVTKKAKAGRLGVSGPPLFCPLVTIADDGREACTRRRSTAKLAVHAENLGH